MHLQVVGTTEGQEEAELNLVDPRLSDPTTCQYEVAMFPSDCSTLATQLPKRSNLKLQPVAECCGLNRLMKESTPIP
jgi:hypothetical protein